MALVQMQRGRPDIQRLQHPHPSYAQHDLLPQPLFRITGIKAVRDVPLPGLVGLDVRIQ